MQTMRRFFFCFVWVASSMLACMPTGFLASKNSAGDSPSAATTEPKIQSNDRPTETGAGVPGYLVNCSALNRAGELVQVGCSVAHADGTRAKVPAESWTRYEIRLPPNANPNIQVSKSIAGVEEAWDVIFAFAGAPIAELRAAAQNSTYSYSHADEVGGMVRTETPPPVVSGRLPAPGQPNPSCSDGVLVEGICVVSVVLSCTEYCSQSQMKVHPWVVERFGSGNPDGRQACTQLYEKFPDRSAIAFNFGVKDVVTSRGFGCHRQAYTYTYFDSSPTDPATSPYFGYSRICACQ